MSSELDDKTAAIHEAGHAVVAHRLGEPVMGMSLRGGSKSHARTMFIRFPVRSLPRRILERRATMALAGPIAVAKHKGSTSTTLAYSGVIGDDATEAVRLLKRIQAITEPEVQRLFDECGQRAMRLLVDRENWRLVERLADELMARKRLYARDIVAIVPCQGYDAAGHRVADKEPITGPDQGC